MFAVDKFKLEVVKEKDEYGSYVIGPLPKGYGVTVGNALRRILLSSIEGAAITSVKVAKVKHEYSTLPGVADDMLTIILKLKKLALRSHSEEEQTLELSVKGKKIVKASDIKLTSEVELSNPDLEITELTDSKAKLDMQIQVERGYGFSKSDETKRSQVGVIPVDANFSPVIKVVMEVSKTRVGQQTDLDQIELDIHTNGVVSPKEALRSACEIYNQVTEQLVSVLDGKKRKIKSAKKSKKEEKNTSSDLDVDKLNLSARLTNSLIKAGYKNLTELEGMSEDEIKEIRGLGKKSAEELVDIMKSYKLKVV
jgi:DNA-directed RNA polymerase subunit alpha